MRMPVILQGKPSTGKTLGLETLLEALAHTENSLEAPGKGTSDSESEAADAETDSHVRQTDSLGFEEPQKLAPKHRVVLLPCFSEPQEPSCVFKMIVSRF